MDGINASLSCISKLDESLSLVFLTSKFELELRVRSRLATNFPLGFKVSRGGWVRGGGDKDWLSHPELA